MGSVLTAVNPDGILRLVAIMYILYYYIVNTNGILRPVAISEFFQAASRLARKHSLKRSLCGGVSGGHPKLSVLHVRLFVNPLAGCRAAC